MSVTVQDILDAGGEIFGLPVWCAGSMYTCGVSRRRTDMELHTGEIYIGNPYKEENVDGIWRKPCDVKVYADGIRVLEIDSKLYRVTGHEIYFSDDGDDLEEIAARIAPLIPDKPAVRFKAGDYVKVVKKRYKTHQVEGKVYKVLYVRASDGGIFLNSGDCVERGGYYYGCFYEADELELADKPAEPEPDPEKEKLRLKAIEIMKLAEKLSIELE